MSWLTTNLSELFAPGKDSLVIYSMMFPLWNLFDLTPEGRGTDWDEQLSY